MNDTAADPALRGLHHVGMSVADLDEALAFWRRFADVEPRWHALLDRPYLGRHVGYPDVRISGALVVLPGEVALELLEYHVADAAPNSGATANPGNVHLCLKVDDARAAWERAVAAGARPLVAEGPVTADAGPNAGAQVAYLRIHDDITLELFQLPH